jgi:hypothetical protein
MTSRKHILLILDIWLPFQSFSNGETGGWREILDLAEKNTESGHCMAKRREKKSNLESWVP